MTSDSDRLSTTASIFESEVSIAFQIDENCNVHFLSFQATSPRRRRASPNEPMFLLPQLNGRPQTLSKGEIRWTICEFGQTCEPSLITCFYPKYDIDYELRSLNRKMGHQPLIFVIITSIFTSNDHFIKFSLDCARKSRNWTWNVGRSRRGP